MFSLDCIFFSKPFSNEGFFLLLQDDISSTLFPYTRSYRKPRKSASPFISCLLLILSRIMLIFGGWGWRRGFPRNKLNKASCSAEAGNVLPYCLTHKEWKILTKQNSRRWSVNWVVLTSCRQIESHIPHPHSSLSLKYLNLKKIHAYVYTFCLNIK